VYGFRFKINDSLMLDMGTLTLVYRQTACAMNAPIHTREVIMFYYRIRRKTTDYDEHLEQLFPSYYN
jgi:hypothetical protein